MKRVLLVVMYILFVKGFSVKPNIKKSFPKITYTKINDISYRGPRRIRRKNKPYTFILIKKINNSINNYLDNAYAMASFPLSYNFANGFNKTTLNEEQ